MWGDAGAVPACEPDRRALGGPKPCPSKPGRPRAAGQQGQRELARQGRGEGSPLARVRDRISRFKSGSGRAKPGDKVRGRGQGPRWRRASDRARKQQRSIGIAGRLHPEPEFPARGGARQALPGRPCPLAAGPGHRHSGPRPRGMRGKRSPETSPIQFQ